MASIDDRSRTKLSKFLSYILRHSPESIGINLDTNGWANVDELLAKTNSQVKNIDIKYLEFVVDTDSKKRFSFNKEKTKIRANQGHSLNINLDYRPSVPPEFLYHGTALKNMESILKNGIEKSARQHVHLSMDRSTAMKVGQRHGKPIVLKILSEIMNAAGYEFYLSKNNIWLTEYVPAAYINKTNESFT